MDWTHHVAAKTLQQVVHGGRCRRRRRRRRRRLCLVITFSIKKNVKP